MGGPPGVANTGTTKRSDPLTFFFLSSSPAANQPVAKGKKKPTDARHPTNKKEQHGYVGVHSRSLFGMEHYNEIERHEERRQETTPCRLFRSLHTHKRTGSFRSGTHLLLGLVCVCLWSYGCARVWFRTRVVSSNSFFFFLLVSPSSCPAVRVVFLYVSCSMVGSEVILTQHP